MIKTINNKNSNWHNIPWKEFNKKVQDLQNKIVKARLENNMKLVYQLQNQLVTSLEGRAIAIRNVVTSSPLPSLPSPVGSGVKGKGIGDGAKTPGVDNITWTTPEQRMKAIELLGNITKNPNTYKSSPLKRIMIPKANSTKLRPLGIPTMLDRAVQAVYLLAVDPVVETNSDKNSFGFRKFRSQHDAIAYIRSILDKKVSPNYILEADISKCFDKISHKFLLQNTPICHKHVLNQWLSSEYIFENKLFSTTEGTPLLKERDGIISPLLCNVALNGMEELIRNAFPARKVVDGSRPKVNLYRFADDLIVTGTNKQTLIQIKQIIEEFLKIRGLELKDSKTRIVTISTGFNFLGFNISRKPFNPRLNKKTYQKTVLIIKPSDKAIESIKLKIREIISKNNELAVIIKEINPLLRGWGNYFGVSYHSQATFISVGHFVWTLMLKWVIKKHPNMSTMKAVSKYIVTGKTASNHKWVWGITKKNTEEMNRLTIFNISEIVIKIHKLLKLDLNPYLLENKAYFQKRIISRNSAKFREAIYKKYNHLCPICGESLHNGEKVELHHIKPAKEGGEYSMSNIQPLHQICHISITHNKAK